MAAMGPEGLRFKGCFGGRGERLRIVPLYWGLKFRYECTHSGEEPQVLEGQKSTEKILLKEKEPVETR